MGMYSAWETTATLLSAVPIERGEGRWHIVAAICLQLVCFIFPYAYAVYTVVSCNGQPNMGISHFVWV